MFYHLDSFTNFKNYLSEQGSKGEKLGLNEEVLAKAATKVADYLTESEKPRNREEKVLKELGKVAADGQEKEAISFNF
ncbi:DUF3243 family protein [Lysinibacillus yapensis]|uniref:DUF3243 family protein n=1 Tax=Ureibacillus yapensis TaxID=2304605 RepID=UPI001F1C313B|nr:DUF3243 family protein [Lysinibacillus yapensis]